MTPKITAYTVVTACTADDLAQAVTRMLPNWQPLGGASTTGMELCQAMVKYDEPATAWTTTPVSTRMAQPPTTIKLPPLEKP